MRLLLFTLLCVFTILFLRTIQRGARGGVSGRPAEPEAPPPAARPDEIVDVPFEELPKAEKAGKGAS